MTTTVSAGNGTLKLSRDQIRASIFNTKPKSEFINIFGCDVELRQPSLGNILEAQTKDDRRAAIVDMIIDYCYVPGTNEKVFEAADAEGILTLPYGEDLSKINDAIARLTNIDVSGEEKNLEEQQDSSMST